MKNLRGMKNYREMTGQAYIIKNNPPCIFHLEKEWIPWWAAEQYHECILGSSECTRENVIIITAIDTQTNKK